ncbi:unnamed protein product [Ectocarpus sp. 12 AP-2014]
MRLLRGRLPCCFSLSLSWQTRGGPYLDLSLSKPATRCLAASTTINMSSSEAANTSSRTTTSSVSSRRERAAQAAERRLQASKSALSTSSAAASIDRGNGAGEPVSPAAGERSRKRKAPSASAQQICFSDSDDGSESGVALVGVVAGPSSPTQRDNTAAAAAGATLAAGKNKRERKEPKATDTSGAAGGVDGAIGVTGAAGRRAEASSAAGSSSGGGSVTPHSPKTCRVVSWNIDCLNGENKMARVEEVCAILLESEPTPDVILLQASLEVDDEMLAVLDARLGGQGRYRAFPPRVPVEQRYFTLTFVKVGTVTVQESGRKDFPHSLMGRDLSTVRATFNGKPMLLMTSHLESEKQSSEERKAQFNQVLKQLLAFRGGPAIFAGDTNLREAEVKQEKLAKEVIVAMGGEIRWQCSSVFMARAFRKPLATRRAPARYRRLKGVIDSLHEFGRTP